MRVVVFGSRSARNRCLVFQELDRIHTSTPITVVISGMYKGIDRYAFEWGQARGLQVLGFRAQWRYLGPMAGPARNQRMVDEGRLDAGIQFPGGDGTEDMARRLRAAMIRIIEVAPRELTAR